MKLLKTTSFYKAQQVDDGIYIMEITCRDGNFWDFLKLISKKYA